MGLGVSIFLIAVGAVLTFALETTADGINLDTVGIILMLVGALGLVLSMMFWSTWGGFNRGDTHTHTEVVERDRVL